MLVPLALFRAKGESSGKLRFLAIVATCLITLAVVLTFSRGAAIGIVAVLLAMASLRYIRLRHLAVVVIGLAAVLVVVPQYATRMTKLGGLWAMVDSDNTSNPTMDGSLQSRFTEMGAAVLVFLDYPLIGVGPGMYRFHYREYAEQIGLRVFAKGRGSHSLYLGLAAESGAIGFVLFAAVVFITLRDLMKIHRRFRETRPDYADIAAAFVLAIVAYLTTAMFLHAAYIRFFWLMMALAYAASRLDDDRPAATVSTQVST
jgi:O-antigen ligase